MKKILLLAAVCMMLTGCSQGGQYELSEQTDSYVEYELTPNNDAFFPVEKARERLQKRENLLSNKGKGVHLTGNEFEESQHGPMLSKGMTEEEIEILKASQPCFGCYEIRSDDDIYLIEEFWLEGLRITKNSEVIFETDAFFGTDGTIFKIQMLDGDLIVNYQQSTGYRGENGPSEDFHVWAETYWEGGMPERFKDLIGPRSMFKYDEKIGFIANNPDDDMVYVYYDGVAISPGYDYIRLTQCCAQEPPHFALHSNGALSLTGSREKKDYFLEVDLNKI